jgi:hypothetical protein
MNGMGVSREEGREDIWAKLGRLDRRIYYWALFLVMIVVFFVPFTLPIQVKEQVRIGYDLIEATPPGSVALWINDQGNDEWYENGGGSIALMKHLMRRGIKFVIVSFVDAFPTTIEIYLTFSGAKDQLVYGVDYVNIGFIAGGEAAVAAFAQDVRGTAKADIYGTPVDELAALDGITNMGDFDLCISLGATTTAHRQWIPRHIISPYLVPHIEHVGAMLANAWYIYYEQGIVNSLIDGSRGGAEYETLIGEAGTASAIQNQQSFGHLVAIVLIGLGNVALISEKMKGGS